MFVDIFKPFWTMIYGRPGTTLLKCLGKKLITWLGVSIDCKENFIIKIAIKNMLGWIRYFFFEISRIYTKKNCYEMKDAFVVLFVSVQTPKGFADQARMKTAVTEAWNGENRPWRQESRWFKERPGCSDFSGNSMAFHSFI